MKKFQELYESVINEAKKDLIKLNFSPKLIKKIDKAKDFDDDDDYDDAELVENIADIIMSSPEYNKFIKEVEKKLGPDWEPIDNDTYSQDADELIIAAWKNEKKKKNAVIMVSVDTDTVLEVEINPL